MRYNVCFKFEVLHSKYYTYPSMIINLELRVCKQLRYNHSKIISLLIVLIITYFTLKKAAKITAIQNEDLHSRPALLFYTCDFC